VEDDERYTKNKLLDWRIRKNYKLILYTGHNSRAFLLLILFLSTTQSTTHIWIA